MKFIVLNVKMDVFSVFFLRTMNSEMFSFKEENERKKKLDFWSKSVRDEYAFMLLIWNQMSIWKRVPRILQ